MEVKKTDVKKVKTSWYLPEDMIKAMDIVFQNKRVMKSHQVEMGLKTYLVEHKRILKKEGIDLWK